MTKAQQDLHFARLLWRLADARLRNASLKGEDTGALNGAAVEAEANFWDCYDKAWAEANVALGETAKAFSIRADLEDEIEKARKIRARLKRKG